MRSKINRKIWWGIKISGLLMAGVMMADIATAAEVIDNFDVQIQVNEDATINVTERIEYNFGADQRHGIYRDIPYKYQAREGNYAVDITDVRVVNEKHERQTFTTTASGRNYQLKIGDADKYVFGSKLYVISYTVKGAINYFDEYDELYWNVTGEDWPVDILAASVKISLPGEINNDINSSCFMGNTGSQAQDCIPDGALSYRSARKMSAGEGMTAVVGWPKGIVYEPTASERMMETAQDNWVVIVPAIAALLMGYLWWTRGRDPKGRGAIVPQYDSPEGLTPSQVGLLIDERADNVDITADIIDLAVKGWIKIVQTDKKILFMKRPDYVLRKLKEPNSDLAKPQLLLMTKLFSKKSEVKLADLKQTWHSEWQEVRGSIYKSLVAEKYFPRNPNTVRMAYAGLGVLAAFVGVGISLLWYGVIGIASFIGTGVIIGLVGMIMPAKTKKGVLALEHIKGLRKYLEVAEKERLKFHNAPDKKPEHFDALLPYAMVLGVEKEWAKQFEGIDRQPPGWYEGPAGMHFSAAVLASNMNSFSTAAGSNLSAAASSGSSGFSGGSVGGGFGGGGGGSW